MTASHSYLIFVRDTRTVSVEKKSVMWRNFKFLYMKHVEFEVWCTMPLQYMFGLHNFLHSSHFSYFLPHKNIKSTHFFPTYCVQCHRMCADMQLILTSFKNTLAERYFLVLSLCKDMKKLSKSTLVWSDSSSIPKTSVIVPSSVLKTSAATIAVKLEPKYCFWVFNYCDWVQYLRTNVQQGKAVSALHHHHRPNE